MGRVGRIGAVVWAAAPPWVWVAVLTALAFLLRRYRLGAESFWFDEADIVSRAQLPLGTLMQGFTAAGENGPLYTLLLHYWLALIAAFPQLGSVLHFVFGSGMEAPVRGLSAIFGTAAIPLMYALGRRVGGVALGLVAALLLTFNPFHIWHSQDAKMYTLLALTSLASTVLYIDALRRNTWKLWAGYVIATWIMLTTHSMSGLVLLAQLAATPWLRNLPSGEHRAERRNAEKQQREEPAELKKGFLYSTLASRSSFPWVSWGWAMLLILGPVFPIVWLRLAAIVTNTVNVGGWYVATTLPDILSTIFVSFAVNRAPQPWEIIGAAAMLTLAGTGCWKLGVASWVARLRGRFVKHVNSQTAYAPPLADIEEGRYTSRRLYPLVFALWIVPVLVFWVITWRVPLFQSRYLIMALPPYLIMAAAGLLALRRLHPALMGVAASILGLASFAALAGVNYSPEAQKEDWRGAMAYVQDHLRLRDAIVVFPGYLVTAANVYYQPGGPGQVPTVPIIANIPSLKTENFGQRELQIALRQAISKRERIWLVTSPERQKQEDPRNLVQSWFQQNWLTFDTRRFNGVTVYGISFNAQVDVWFPAPVYPEAHNFTNGLTFTGYIYEIRADATVQRDASYFPLTLYWRNGKLLTEDYVFRVQIKGKDGKLVVVDEAGPLNGYWPTTRWPLGTNVIDYRDIRLPGGMTPGNYTITLQVYPKGRPDSPLKAEDGSTEIVFQAPLPVVPWKP